MIKKLKIWARLLRLKFFGVRLKKWTGQQEAILTPRNLKKGISTQLYSQIRQQGRNENL